MTYFACFISKKGYCFNTNKYNCDCPNGCKYRFEIDTDYPFYETAILKSFSFLEILETPTLEIIKNARFELKFRVNNILFYEEID